MPIQPRDRDDGDLRLGATDEQTAGLWGLGARIGALNRDPNPDRETAYSRMNACSDQDAAYSRMDTRSDSEDSVSGNRRRGWIIGGLVLLAVILIAVFVNRKPGYQDPGGQVVVTDAFGRVLTNPELFGKTLYLKRGNSGGYRFTTGSDYDKKLTWDKAKESYYDDETGLWLWFNTDVKPPLWQYWYEPISGDYGNYGWMEYENGKWYIETRPGSWSTAPPEYDTSALWYVETNANTSKHSAVTSTALYDDSEEDLKTAQAILADTDEDLEPTDGS